MNDYPLLNDYVGDNQCRYYCTRCGFSVLSFTTIQNCPTCTQLGLLKKTAANEPYHGGESSNAGTGQFTEYKGPGHDSAVVKLLTWVLMAFLLYKGWMWVGLPFIEWIGDWPTWVKWTVGLVLTSPIWGPFLDKKIMES